MNRPVGSGPQPLRGIPGNVYQAQQASTSRTGTLGSGRLQNGKLTNTGSQPGWGFGLGMGGTPGMPTQQSRTNPLSSFAQTIGGSQPQTPLDLSEFPSLSGAPRSQQTSSSQSLWSNAPLRNPQAAPVHRPQNQSQGQQSTSSQQSQGEQLQEDQNSVYSQFGQRIDDYRAGYRSAAPLSSTSDRIDDFPPLGGLGGADVGRGNGSNLASQSSVPIGGSPFGAISNAATSQPQSSVLDRLDSQRDAHSPSRSPLDAPFGQPGDLHGLNQSSIDGNTLLDSHTSQMLFRNNSVEEPQQHNGSQNGVSAEDQSEQATNSQMSESDRWGLAGFLDKLRSTDQDHQALMLGMDLSSLGFDLQRQEPLYLDWAGPFSDPLEPPMIPDFLLPPAYKVSNVPPLRTKITSFSDETLFAIFYQNPRDQAQEWAAAELYNRDWRWHKELRCWMMKAKEFGEPLQLPSHKEERGFYYFFDVIAWKRERKEFILNYDHLYHQPQLGSATQQPIP